MSYASADSASLDNQESFSAPQIFAQLQQSFASDRTRSLRWRQAQLNALQSLLKQHTEELISALYQDLGKSKTEAWTSEIGFLLTDIKHTLRHLKKWMRPHKVPTPLIAQPGSSAIFYEPLGCVLVIGAWNYPLQLTLAPCIAAIAAGNCVLLKPSELAPATSALIKKLIPRYLDNTAIAVIEGGKAETTDLLAQTWDHIFYTGGETVGKIVMQAASQNLTPVTLELGGKSPCLVERSADVEIAARRIVWGKWMNAGQTCVAPDYVIVEECVKDALLKAMKQEIRAQYTRQPLQSPDYGKIINRHHFDRLCGYLENQHLYFGGETDPQEHKIGPTIVLDPDADSPIMQEEIFGPLLPVLTTTQISESLDFIRQRAKPLALYLFTNDKKLEHRVIRKVSAGSVCVNDVMMFMTNANLPFGGVGASGMGQYHGHAGFAQLSHKKSVMIRKFWLDVAVRYAPFSSFKLALLKKLL